MNRIAQAAIAAVCLAGFGFVLLPSGASHAEAERLLPAPVLDETPGNATQEVAVFAGGCFWGVQGVFQHVAGVTNAVSGYAGGEARTARYFPPTHPLFQGRAHIRASKAEVLYSGYQIARSDEI